MSVAAATLDALYGPDWRLKALLRRNLFDRQLRAFDDPCRFKALHPGRRAGKSTALPAYALMYALDCRPTQLGQLAEVVMMIGETRQKAESQFWAPLNALIKAYALPFAWNGKVGAFLHTRGDGTGIYLWGLADKGAADMLRGFKVRAALADEVATYAQYLKYLVEDVLGPALGDLDGTLILAGTPSLTRAGEWFKICNGERPGWSVHHWDVRDNPKFPRDPHEYLRQQAARFAEGVDAATYQRESLGLFVNDSAAQVYRYLAERNDCDMPAHHDADRWTHHVIVDFGVNDDCAWSVLAAHPHEPVVYCLESFKRPGMRTGEAADVTAELARRYKPVRVIGDTGGLGKPYALEWNARYTGQSGMPAMECADKAEKRAGIELVNDALRGDANGPRIRLVRGACEALTGELVSLPWKDDKRLVEHPAYPNHCADTLLYGYKSMFAYLHSAPDERPDPRTDPQGADRWAERQEIAELERRASVSELEADWGAF